ncbi:MAG: cupredoxin domain-containing protein [Chloroflexota bacterium]|nr:cupredoxin domain-containing protein [Chloroflexota bacterium]
MLTAVALGATLIAAAPAFVGAQGTAAPAPKAYIGLFKDNAVAVLDTATNKVMKTIPIPTGPHGLVVTPDGRWVYASSDGDSTVSLIDTRTDQVSGSIDVGQTPHGLAITPDGSRVLVAGFGTDRVEAIDTSTNQVVWELSVPQPHNMAITPDGATAYAASQQKGSEAIAIIDLGTGTQTGSMPLDHTPRALNVSSEGADIAYTLAGVDALQVTDLTSQQLETQITTGASPHHPLFTPDGKLGLVVSQGPGTLDLFDPATYTATASIKVGTMPHWIGVTSDSRWAYVTNENSNDVSVVDLTDRKVTATVPVGNAPRKIVVQPGPSASAPAGQPSAGGTWTTAPQASAPAAAAPAPAAPAPDVASISIGKFAFEPTTITVTAGQPITFTNSDPVAHTSTSSTGAWDSGEIAPGGSFTTTLQQPGTYAYRCSIHPFMQATVVVQG